MKKIECIGCGMDFESDNEDDQVLMLCSMCLDYGSDYETDMGLYAEFDYCTHEDYPCCGCS